MYGDDPIKTPPSQAAGVASYRGLQKLFFKSMGLSNFE